MSRRAISFYSVSLINGGILSGLTTWWFNIADTYYGSVLMCGLGLGLLIGVHAVRGAK